MKLNKSRLIEILAENNFFVENSHVFKPDPSEYTFLYNKLVSRGIVIKEYNVEIDFKNVNEEAALVKEILKKMKYNIWNMYYFVLINTDNQIKKNYIIERDYRNMRKYLIQSVEDLKRIPFLEKTTGLEEEINLSIDYCDLIESSQDQEINKIIKNIVCLEGEYVELSKQKIRNILKDNLSRGELL